FEATVIEVVLVSGLAGIYIDSFAERRWQRWRRIRHIASLRRARLEELESRAFVGGHLTRAVADEHVRQTVGETVATEERKPERKAQRMEKVRERVRQWSRARREEEIGGRRQEQEAGGSGQESAGERGEGEDARGGREKARGGRAGTRLRSLAPVAALAAMPIMLKVGLLLTLASIFLRIGTVTFGGGFVMVPLIEAEVVNGHGWLTHQEFVEAF